MELYCQIELTQGQVARVSPEDFDELSKIKWYAAWFPKSKAYYVHANVRIGCGKWTKASMHRLIAGNPVGLLVDHINGDTLDNRRENLRLATSADNGRNSKKRSNNTSGFKGVSWSKHRRQWTSHIRTKGSNIYLGYFETPESAYAAYCASARFHHGEFARVA